MILFNFFLGWVSLFLAPIQGNCFKGDHPSMRKPMSWRQARALGLIDQSLNDNSLKEDLDFLDEVGEEVDFLEDDTDSDGSDMADMSTSDMADTSDMLDTLDMSEQSSSEGESEEPISAVGGMRRRRSSFSQTRFGNR